MVAPPAQNLYHLASVLGVCRSPQCQRSASMISGNMNENVLPCDNFYEYACGNFKNRHPIPQYREHVSNFTLRRDEINAKVLNFLQRADLRAFPNIRRLYEMYMQCMQADVESNGMEIIGHHLKMLGLPSSPPFHTGISKSFDEIATLAKIHRYSPQTLFLFNIGVHSDPQNLPLNHIHFGLVTSVTKAPIQNNKNQLQRLIAEIRKIRPALIQYITKTVNFMYENLGVEMTSKMKKMINTRVIHVADFLIKLDKAVNIDKIRKADDVTYKSLAEFQSWTNNFLQGGKIQINWNHYLEVLFKGIAHPDLQSSHINWSKIMLQSPQQLTYTLKVLKNTERDTFVCAMWFAVIESINSFAPIVLQNALETYSNTVIETETWPREEVKEEKCINYLMNIASHLVGYVLAHGEEGQKNRHMVKEMVENIRQSLRETIQETFWLDEITKTKAIQKANSITSFVSFSNFHLYIEAIEHTYESLSMKSTYYETLMNILQTSRRNSLSVILTHNNFNIRRYIGTNPGAVQATYSQNYMHLTLSTGIVGFPFFDLGLEPLDYGAMGSYIGHEMGHGFDLQGIKYNGRGQWKLWLSNSAKKEYEKEALCFKKSYNKFHFNNIKKTVNGELTLSENIADAIGFAAALKAYKKRAESYGMGPMLENLETFTHEKLFTLAFANAWCQNSTPRHLKEIIENDVHSPASARVNGVLMNSKDFASIWQCAPDTPMNPTDKCKLFS